MCTCAPPERTKQINQKITLSYSRNNTTFFLLREPRGARQELRNLIRIILDSQFFFFLTITIMMGSLLLASAGDRRRTIIRLLLVPRSLLLVQSVLFAFLLEYFAGISADFEGKGNYLQQHSVLPANFRGTGEKLAQFHDDTGFLLSKGEVFCIYYNPERLFLAAQFDALSLFFTSRRRR